MKRLYKIGLTILCCMLCCMLFVSCGEEDGNDGNVYQVYYISNGETKVEIHPHQMQAAEEEGQLRELLDCLSTNPEKLEYKAPFTLDFQVRDVRLAEGRLTIDVDEKYTKLPPTTEVLVRAAVVHTLTQLPTVNYVTFTVEGNQFFDSMGKLVGWMSADQFIFNDGNEINTHELAKVKLYFATEDGTGLVETFREKHYSTSTPLERFVVEELIAGPGSQIAGMFPVINPQTKIANVITKDGICYVNLDESFLTVVNNVPTEVSVYAIVNSLVELSNVNKVQILINGEVPANFAVSTFERNLDIVTTLEK